MSAKTGTVSKITGSKNGSRSAKVTWSDPPPEYEIFTDLSDSEWDVICSAGVGATVTVTYNDSTQPPTRDSVSQGS